MNKADWESVYSLLLAKPESNNPRGEPNVKNWNTRLKLKDRVSYPLSLNLHLGTSPLKTCLLRKREGRKGREKEKEKGKENKERGEGGGETGRQTLGLFIHPAIWISAGKTDHHTPWGTV